ncbi:MAG: hypothetical protein KJ063_11550 [Anaerolineae bacterium]|nr:hypothetical protein [Anaerolineae bacterium]
MKQSLFLLLALFLAACTARETTINIPSTPETATLALATTAVPLVEITAIAQPIQITPTPIPTSAPTETPQLTPTPIPPPTGHIYFLWDPEPLPITGFGNPVQNLYQATYDKVSGMWNIETVIENLIGWPASILSPSKSMVALTPLEDRNKDGFVSQEGYNRGFDAPNLYAFDLISKVLNPVTTNFPEINEHQIHWLIDNQTIMIVSAYTISLTSLTHQNTQQVGPTFSSHIIWADLSPSTQTVVVNTSSDGIFFLDIATGMIILNLEQIGGNGVYGGWAPNGKWVALKYPSAHEFLFINSETLAVESIFLEGLINQLVWNPIDAVLLLHEYTEVRSRILLFDPELSVFELVSELPTDVTVDYLGWSPDGETITYLFKKGKVASLYSLAREAEIAQKIWQSEDVGRFNFSGWSPDYQWILIFSGQQDMYTHDEHATIEVVHKDGRATYELYETTGFHDPYGFFWLP